MRTSPRVWPGTRSLPFILISFVLLVCSSDVLADRDWAIGMWRIQQNFSVHHEKTAFSGRLRIGREDGHFTGRIYFDSVGRWEQLEDVHVSDDTIRFFRPEYPQEFHGRRKNGRIEGTWQDREKKDWEWTWEAERD
jgi:hypothetical protein